MDEKCTNHLKQRIKMHRKHRIVSTVINTCPSEIHHYCRSRSIKLFTTQKKKLLPLLLAHVTVPHVQPLLCAFLRTFFAALLVYKDHDTSTRCPHNSFGMICT